MKNNNLKIIHITAFCFMALLLASSPVLADDDDQEVAREALSKGLIRPLSELLEKIESMYSGHILEVELESEDDYNDEDGEILIYEIKFLTLQGNVVKLKFDAKNLELLVTDGWDLDKAKKKYEDDD